MRQNTLTIPFLAPFESHGFTHLDVTVTHYKGGHSGFDWTYKPSAHRLSFSPCIHKDNGFTESILMSGNQWESGFFLPLNSDARRNPHYIKRALLALEPCMAGIRDAFESKDAERLKEYARVIDLRAQLAKSKTVAHIPEPQPTV